MSKEKAYLWKAARKNVPGLPDCPSTLSEPRYAAFLFDQYCFVSSLVSEICTPYANLIFISLVAWHGRQRSSIIFHCGSVRLAATPSTQFSAVIFSRFMLISMLALSIFAGEELRPTRFVQLQHKDQYWSLLVAATMDRMSTLS